MKTGALGFELIKRSEVFVSYVYDDKDPQWPRRRLVWGVGRWQYSDGTPAIGTPTFGYGFLAHTYDDCPNGITEDVAADRLRLRLSDYEAAVNRAWSEFFGDRPLNQNQFDALADFAWNEGKGAVRTLISHLATIDITDQDAVRPFFVSWDKWTINHKLVENAGLLHRRLQEVALFFRPIEIAWGPSDIDKILQSVSETADAETEAFRAGSAISDDEDPH